MIVHLFPASDAGFLGGEEVIRRFSVLNIGRRQYVGGSAAANDQPKGLTLKDVRQIFAASQHDEIVNAEEKKVVADDDDARLNHHQELMTFSEFLEGLARLGVLKFGGYEHVNGESEEEALSYYECIKLVVDKACSIVAS